MRRAAINLLVVAGLVGGCAVTPAPAAPSSVESVPPVPSASAEPTVQATPAPSEAPASPTIAPTAAATVQPSSEPTPALKSIDDLINGKQPNTTAEQARAAIAAALKLPAAKSDATYADAPANLRDCTASGTLPYGDRALACFLGVNFAFGLYVATGDDAFYGTALKVHSYAVHNLPRDSVNWIDSRLRMRFA